MNREKAERYAHAAMVKFVAGDLMSEQDWDALSWLTPIDRNLLQDNVRWLGRDNLRWATGNDERVSNMSFYLTIAVGSNFYGWVQ
jgi:hypothetical protein